MQITAEPLEHRQVRLTVEVSPERLERAMQQTAQAFARHLKIPGYRPGKVPLRRITEHVDEADIREKALEQLRDEVVREAIRQKELVPAAPATVKLVSEEPPTYEALIPLAPEVDLGDYRTQLRVPPVETEEITEADVDDVIEEWREDLAFLTPVDRPAERGDIMRLALVGRLDDEIVFDDSDLELGLDRETAPDDANLPSDVVDELIGLEPDDEHTFTVTYSELWPQPELQGREVAFEAEVLGVSTVELPPLDDDLAKELGDAETLDELRERVRAELERRAEMAVREERVERAVDALVELADVDYPPTLLELRTAEMVADLRSRVERQGFEWQRWLELQETDQDEIWTQTEPEAEARLVRTLVLRAFQAAEGIELDEEELERETTRMRDAMRSMMPRTSRPDDESLRQDTANRLLTRRVLDRLLEIAGEAEDDAAGNADADQLVDRPAADEILTP